MDVFLKVTFFLSAFIIFKAMVGYPISIKIIGHIYKGRTLIKDYSLIPTVTLMVVAHNEEKVIYDKLINIINVDYPKDKIEFLISSDNSVDNTNEIVKNFINNNKQIKIRLYEVQTRKGKTNAQNEAQKTITSDFIVMTDANSMLKKNAVKELMAAFTSDKIAYVCGKLSYINIESSIVSESESAYWEMDLKIREIESRIQTITAGNGAIYACRTKDYIDFKPIKSHDSAMPLYFALNGKRAIANHDAIAYEKAGEVISDEFKRKVRMNRELLKGALPTLKILNFFKYRWFTYFYLGHRTCRYLLWLSHLILYVTNLFLITLSNFYLIIFLFQNLFFSLALIKLIFNSNNKYITIIYYYCVTVVAQWVGVFKILTGKTKPFWEKADTTR